MHKKTRTGSCRVFLCQADGIKFRATLLQGISLQLAFQDYARFLVHLRHAQGVRICGRFKEGSFIQDSGRNQDRQIGGERL